MPITSTGNTGSTLTDGTNTLGISLTAVAGQGAVGTLGNGVTVNVVKGTSATAGAVLCRAPHSPIPDQTVKQMGLEVNGPGWGRDVVSYISPPPASAAIGVWRTIRCLGRRYA